jgi:hypothetical protein
MIAETAAVYAAAFEAITGEAFVQDVSGASVRARVEANCAALVAGRG